MAWHEDDVPGVDACSSVLVDQTMIYAASLMADGRCPTRVQSDPDENEWRWTTAECLVNFAMLLDCVLLYERLLVIPPGVGSPLKEALIEEQILEEIAPTAFEYVISKDLGNIFNSLGNFRRLLVDTLVAADFAGPEIQRNIASVEYRHGVFDNEFVGQDQLFSLVIQKNPPFAFGTEYRSPLERVGSLLSLASMQFESPGSNPEAEKRWISKMTKRASSEGGAHLRTLVYWRLAHCLNIPLCPSTRRVAILDALNAQLRRTAQGQVYAAVAAAYGRDVAIVAADNDEAVIKLPPSVALFLDTLEACRDMRQALREFRLRFAPLRKRLREIQAQGREGTIGDRKASKQRLQEVLRKFTGDGPEVATTVVRDVIALAPEAAKVMANPMDLASYIGLLQKPPEWLRTWWVRRPYEVVLSFRKDVGKTEMLAPLLRRVLGIELSAEEVDDFAGQYDRYGSLFAGL